MGGEGSQMDEIANITVGGTRYPLRDETLRGVVGDVGALMDEFLEPEYAELAAKLDELNGEVV